MSEEVPPASKISTPEKSNPLKYILLVILGLAIFVFAPFSLTPVFESIDIPSVPYILAIVARTGSSLIGVTLIIATASSIILKGQNKPIKKVWLIAGAVLIITFLAMFITLMSGISSMYSLPKQD